MQGYKPWQLVLGYIIGLAVLVALLIVVFLGRVIYYWVWDRLWEVIFWVWGLVF